jgi:hypothetical protein
VSAGEAQNTRVLLATLWVAALVAALGVVEAYFWLTDGHGHPLLMPADRADIYPTVVGIYSATVGPILVAVYFRPFKRRLKPERARLLAGLAVALTLIYNVILIYLIAQGLWSEIMIDDILAQAKQAALLLGFLVVPVNGFYFGLKSAP